ncbi:division/cell wall cluster transcriptional repressor MraZ [Sphaerobacter thermophilus]|uniref:Transcriptional regulator MraZ n=1 Tax=Sphaerobacter thermophilus (strain ATCC 49802 / DSM 20745 / KCCM 41009 / NCIMB 13125 / S 6022) TaxID=479434 RepID=D1C5B2_SPHTD|nr:division/cell wall cluster transcriptional repressor MraZ [Sphaerobacter thermophilus]ACZ39429.1 MraZ protein [Sphaerobacter thermophilus DSM 20745]PZN66159.1 MAG: transcriptional regulator MraZ [Sphaerobacter thermophilus]
MFLGRYSHNLDAKGRLAIPARFREALGSDVVITRGIDRCLSLYPMAAWQPLAEKVSALPISDPDARTFRRMVFAEAATAEFDRQGRILIPPDLRRYAGLDREAIVVGMHTYIEIWSPEQWEAQAEMMDSEGSSIAQRLASLI